MKKRFVVPMTQCLWCGNEQPLDVYVKYASATLGPEIWLRMGPTFLCPRCKRQPREPNTECDIRIHKKLTKEDIRRMKQ